MQLWCTLITDGTEFLDSGLPIINPVDSTTWFKFRSWKWNHSFNRVLDSSSEIVCPIPIWFHENCEFNPNPNPESELNCDTDDAYKMRDSWISVLIPLENHYSRNRGNSRVHITFSDIGKTWQTQRICFACVLCTIARHQYIGNKKCNIELVA